MESNDIHWEIELAMQEIERLGGIVVYDAEQSPEDRLARFLA